MDSANWQAVGTAAAMAFVGWQSWRSNKQTKSTGNGFAKHVRDDLADIKKEQREQRDLLTHHLADHAGSDLARRGVS